MEGSFSDSVYRRLPSAIRKLDLVHQDVYIHLRLRRSEEDISRLRHLPPEDLRSKINRVREELIKVNQIDLIEDPTFVPFDPLGPDVEELQLPSQGLSIDKSLIVKEFLSILHEIINKLPPHQSRILRLKYSNRMSAREILEFSKKLNIDLIPGKDSSEVKEQDIFYALNKTFKTIRDGLQERYREEGSFSIDNIKYIFEEIEL